MMSFENIFTPYKARKLTEADVPDILGLYLENTEYFKHCPPRPSRETVEEDLAALPPAKEATDKYFIGIFDGNFLVAVMDLIDRYPDNRTAFIGLFMVCAICGATVALAHAGLLDHRPHTSNGAGFLDMFCPSYKGQGCYVDQPSVSDGSLITASGAGALLWAKQIIERMGVFRHDTLEAWYAYFSTGEAQHFFKLMQTLPSANQ